MRSRVYETVWSPSIRPSIIGPPQAAAAGLPAGRRYRSIAARPALSSKCEQCHIVSKRRKLKQTCYRLILWSRRSHIICELMLLCYAILLFVADCRCFSLFTYSLPLKMEPLFGKIFSAKLSRTI